MFMDVTFHETIHFFSSPIPVPSFLYDSDTGGEGEKLLQIYSRKKRMTVLEDPPASHHDVSSDPSPASVLHFLLYLLMILTF